MILPMPILIFETGPMIFLLHMDPIEADKYRESRKLLEGFAFQGGNLDAQHNKIRDLVI